MPKSAKNIIGAWAFLIGVVLAVVLGLIGISSTQGIAAIVLVILGIVIGLLNIGGTELKDFLLAGTVLVIVSALGGQYYADIKIVGDIVRALVVLFVPATIVVALKSVFAIAKK